MTKNLKLPRLVDSHPQQHQIQKYLESNTTPLWTGSTFSAVTTELTRELQEILRQAKVKNILTRGFEGIERKLQSEKKGIELADQKSGATRNPRISRLIILTNDGTERFHRKAASLLREHGERVLAIIINSDAGTLGKQLFGEGKSAKMLMLDHKESVSAALIAIATAINT